MITALNENRNNRASGQRRRVGKRGEYMVILWGNKLTIGIANVS